MVQKTQFDQTSRERERERERDTLISFFLGLPVGFFWSSLELPKHSCCFESFQFDPAIIHSKEMVLFASIAFKLIGSSSIDLNLLHSLKLRIVSRLRKSTLSRRRIFGENGIYGHSKGADCLIRSQIHTCPPKNLPRGCGVLPCRTLSSNISSVSSALVSELTVQFPTI